jgi:glycine/D-amino acid oxidase-like deaminating enzyme
MQDAATYVPSAHRGFHAAQTGADLFLDRDAIAEHFGFLSRDIVAVLHARRCGWMSGQQLGMHLLDEAKAAGVAVVQGRVTRVGQTSGQVDSVNVALQDGRTERIDTPVFVNAAGPYARIVSQMLGVDLPLFSELHLKIAFEDTRTAIDRNTGLVILDDAQTLPWPDDVYAELVADDATRWMTEALPAGIHLRPDGYDASQTVLMLWDYHSTHRYDAPVFPLPDDPYYPELAMRGLVRLVPKIAQYLDALPHSYADGGYYTKTVENRPLIGPLPVAGAFVNAAHSGFGLMAAPAAAELLAAQIVGTTVPTYAPSFALTRYADPGYQRMLANWGSTGQL